VVLKSKDLTIVSFRGTEPGNFADWQQDVNANLKEVNVGGRICKSHPGWWEATEKILPQLRKELEGATGRVVLTGHSAGGNKALAAATMLAANPDPDQQYQIAGVYNFGTPRLGNHALKETVDELLPGRVFHFTSKRDIVPKVLTKFPGGYVDIGMEMHFDHNGSLIADPAAWNKIRDCLPCIIEEFKEHNPIGAVTGVISDHSLSHDYIPNLEKNRNYVPLFPDVAHIPSSELEPSCTLDLVHGRGGKGWNFVPT